MPRAYYNEFDPHAASWLRNLIARGLIPDGDVDERSIVDVLAGELDGYDQHHFFAGLGGWPLAMRLAGWPDDREVVTGSTPCQPFSRAGLRAGFDDARHLWPHFRRIVEERRPAVLFGEQVAGASDWLRLVRGDLGAMGYAVGAMPVQAASAGAEHLRDRYWFVADRHGSGGGAGQPASPPARHRPAARAARGPVPVALAPDATGDASDPRVVRQELEVGDGCNRVVRTARIGSGRYVEAPGGRWLRLPESGVCLVADGIPGRVDRLRALGNAIDPRPAVAFVSAWMEIDDARRTGTREA